MRKSERVMEYLWNGRMISIRIGNWILSMISDKQL